MEKSRLETLEDLLAADPNDSFVRYGIAQEWAKRGDFERARACFEDLRGRDPGYVATYYHLGKTYERLNRPDDARRTYREGMTVAAAKGDGHARSELGDALDLLEGV